MISLLFLTGCTAEVAVPQLEPGSEPTEQTIAWEKCYESFECTAVAAPVDWTQDTGEFLAIRLMRKEGTADREPILVNPGGPGSSTIAWMRDGYETLGTSWLRENFQVVGFDPRGVGESTAVRCSDLDLKDKLLYSQSEFEYASEEDVAAATELMGQFAASCQEQGPSVGYFNTQQTARDMDLIRQLLGSEKLNYIGFSYGTELGATYAALFPDRVGKFVLDGAVDPTKDPGEKLLGQVRGFDQALRAYLADCLASTYCPFDGDVESAMAQIADFLQDRETSTLPTDSDRELGISATLAGIIVTLYSEQSWPYLSQAFDFAFSGDGSIFLFLADFYNDRDPEGGYLSNINEANYAINCADSSLMPEGRDVTAEILEASPVFGRYFAYPDVSCEGWPDGIGMQQLDYSVPLSGMPLVVGTTGDPATPYDQAVSLAELLDGARLVTLEGEGHTAYGDNSCVNNLVDLYLEGVDLGEAELTCF